MHFGRWDVWFLHIIFKLYFQWNVLTPRLQVMRQSLEQIHHAMQLLHYNRDKTCIYYIYIYINEMEITEETRAFRAPMVARLWLLHIVAIVFIVLRIDFVLAGNSWPVHSKTYAVIQLVAIQNYANVSQDLPSFPQWTSFCRSSAFCATKAWLSERNCAWTWRGTVEIVFGMQMGTSYVVELVISVLGCSTKMQTRTYYNHT